MIIVTQQDLAALIAKAMYEGFWAQQGSDYVEKTADYEGVSLDGQFDLVAIGLHVAKVLEGDEDAQG